MPQLLRREFLLKVLMTIGTINLINFTGFTQDQVLSMSMGESTITEADIEIVYQALTVVSANV